MLNIIFDQDFPDEVRPSIERYMAKFGRFVPQWLSELRFRWDEDNTEDLANMTVRMDYRRASMNVAPAFLSLDDDHRQSIFLHEIAHLYNTPLYSVGMDVIALLCPDKDDSEDATTVQLYKTLKERLRESVEGCNSDLTYMLDKLQDDLVINPDPPRTTVHIDNTINKEGVIKTSAQCRPDVRADSILVSQTGSVFRIYYLPEQHS